MREIAGTALGGNALVAGLICHVAALGGSMTTASGGDLFLKSVYPAACLAFALGAYLEIKSAGYFSWTGWRWYLAAVASILPIAGPLIVLGLIYQARYGQMLSGLLPAVLRLRANLLFVFVLLFLLFLLFAMIRMQSDPYFRRRAPEAVSFHQVIIINQQLPDREVPCFR